VRPSKPQVSYSERHQLFADAHLDDPAGIAVDTDGIVYVTNRGDLQNVSVFSPDGQYRRSIGKKGGRPEVGRFDPDGMLRPGGCAVDSEGRLWVAECIDYPKRFSVWDTASGAPVDQFFGAAHFATQVDMDPHHPDEVYCDNVLWKVDLDTGEWKPYSTIWRRRSPNMVQPPGCGGHAGHFQVFTAENGRQFGWGQQNYSHMLYMRDGDVFKPIAGTLGRGHRRPIEGLFPALKDTPSLANEDQNVYLWQDENDDQCVQPDEVHPSRSNRPNRPFCWIDSDLTAWSSEGIAYEPVRFTDGGRPIYDFSQYKEIPFRGYVTNQPGLFRDRENSDVYIFRSGTNAPTLARYRSDGEMVWGIPPTLGWHSFLGKGLITPGVLHAGTRPVGIAGDYTGIMSYFGPCHLFTTDGLYVGMILNDKRVTGKYGADVLASETFTGKIVKPDGMDRYFFLGGDQDGRVTEIHGLDTVKRLKGGTYTVTEEMSERAQAAWQNYTREKNVAKKPSMPRGRDALDQGPGITVRGVGNREFTFHVARNQTNLYVKWEVISPTKLVNAIGQPKQLFAGGNCLDLQIATDPGADEDREKPAPGDIRLLVTRQKGQPVAVLYRPEVEDFTGKPVTYTSPVRELQVDRVTRVKNVDLDYEETSTGYNAVLRVPLDGIGLTLRPGTLLRMDVGVIFGNEGGNEAVDRAYWANNSADANVIDDLPTEARLQPGKWGEIIVE
jgi:hypothetical protein